MKTLGLIGGMSWESTVEYYRLINRMVRDELGGLHSAECLMVSFDFDRIEALQTRGDWHGAGIVLADAARTLQTAGADGVLICTNTMHKVADAVQAAIDIPVLHIADGTGVAVQDAGIARVGLLGTRYTMEQDFYRQRLVDRSGLDVIVPDEAGRQTVHDVIFDELVRGIIRDESRRAYQHIIASLVDAGAQGVILGCTEIGLLVKPADSPVPVFDTTALHAQAAVAWMLGG